MKAAGFPCQRCGQDRLAEIIEWSDAATLTLRCPSCKLVTR